MVQQQFEALLESGHEVRLFSFSNDVSLNGSLNKLQAAFITATAFGKFPQEEIDSYCPDIILVNNLFPNVGSRWIRKSRIPVVGILHNYRYFCATGLNFRDNKQCFDCSNISPLEGLRHKCYRNSFLATLPLTIAQFRREYLYNELNEFDFFIALSDGAKDKLVSAGLSDEKTTVIPNFIEDFARNEILQSQTKNGRWICVGRISIDKGFLNLVENWPDDYNLDIVGDGPEMHELKMRIEHKSNICVLGQLDREVILNTLSEYSGAIHPSLWPEVCPLTVIEFLCAGLPIVTLESNTSSVILVETTSGIALKSFTKDLLHFALGDIDQNYELYSKNARLTFLRNYTKSSWINRIDALLNELLANRKE
jgi:glycosyltransferase involved in cell wall biosynthesis